MAKLQQPMLIEDRLTFPLETGTGSDIAQFAINFNGSPALATANGMVGSNDGVANTYYKFPKFDWLKNLYEMVRCRWIKVQFIPRMPADTAATANYNPLYIIKERDGLDDFLSNTPPNIESIVTEPAMKIKNWFRPWKLFQRSAKYGLLTKIPPAPVGSALQTGENLFGQWHGIGSPIGTLTTIHGPHILATTQDGPTDTVLGTIVVTASFMCRGSIRVTPP